MPFCVALRTVPAVIRATRTDPEGLRSLFVRLCLNAALVTATIGWCVGQFQETNALYSNASCTFQVLLDSTGWRVCSTMFVSHPSWQLSTWANRDDPWIQISNSASRITLFPGIVFDSSESVLKRRRLSATHTATLAIAVAVFTFSNRNLIAGAFSMITRGRRPR